MTDSKLVITAYIWNFISNVIVRSMGIVSTLVLVRVLDSEDFGIVAIAMLIKGFAEVLSDVGVNRYIILKEDPSNSDYYKAWTFNLVLKALAALCLSASAGLLSSFFENPNLTNLVYCMSLLMFIDAIRNIGLVKLEKEINFSIKNKLLVIAKVVSFIVTVSFAFYFKSYVALISGMLINSLVFTLLSYKLCGFRPRFDFSIRREMVSTSSFFFFRSLIGFTRAQIDTLLVSKFFGKSATGDLTVAKQFATMPYGELIAPGMAPMFSALSKLKSSRAELHTKALQSIFLMLTLILPCSIGIYLVRVEFTTIVLGDDWSHLANILGWLGLMMLPFTITPVLNILFDAYNRIKVSIALESISVVLLLVFMLNIAHTNLETFVILRVNIGLGMIIISVLSAAYFVQFSIPKFSLLVAFLAVPNMFLWISVEALTNNLATDSTLFLLLAKVLIGASFYFLTLVAMIGLQVFYFKNDLLKAVLPEFVYERFSIFSSQ